MDSTYVVTRPGALDTPTLWLTILLIKPWALQALEMPASSQDQRKSDTAAGRNRRRELFKEEDVKLQWSTVRKAVSHQPHLHSIDIAWRLSCMRCYTCHQDGSLCKTLSWSNYIGSISDSAR